ncbi:MAG: hypothetical protein KAT43_03430 [Nanoarchaeota archaeon]|nr:hypothetical protein [Nanoarchaeota archaeon]
MGKYEEAMAAVLREAFPGARRITREHGDDGFEYRTDCFWCPYKVYGEEGPSFCANNGTDDSIRMVDGGEINGGKCYEFYSLERFWDDFSSTHAIDPETGEVFQI